MTIFTIKKAEIKDVKALTEVGKKAFFVPHKDAIPKKIMDTYIQTNFNEKQLLSEITNPQFQYHLIYHNQSLAGFSKVIFNQKNEHIASNHVTKLERFYLLEDFYGLGLGIELFKFNLELCKKNNQKGIWLYTWIKNYRALSFYKKVGFHKIALYDFPISETETRLNDLLYLKL